MAQAGCNQSCPPGYVRDTNCYCVKLVVSGGGGSGNTPNSIISAPVTGNRTFRVTYRIGNSVQTIQVFANNQNDAVTYAKRIVGNFQLVSVVEFNTCSNDITNNAIAVSRQIRGII